MPPGRITADQEADKADTNARARPVISRDPTPQAMLEGYRAALVVPAVAALLAAAVMAFGLRRHGRDQR